MISWKGASLSNRDGVCFSDGGGFIFKRGGGAPLGGIGFDEGFLKKIVGWGRGGGMPPNYGWKTLILDLMNVKNFHDSYSLTTSSTQYS